MIMLNSPSLFVIIAIMIALAAYLRQASENAADLFDLIRGNKVWNYPFQNPPIQHTKIKAAELHR